MQIQKLEIHAISVQKDKFFIWNKKLAENQRLAKLTTSIPIQRNSSLTLWYLTSWFPRLGQLLLSSLPLTCHREDSSFPCGLQGTDVPRFCCWYHQVMRRVGRWTLHHRVSCSKLACKESRQWGNEASFLRHIREICFKTLRACDLFSQDRIDNILRKPCT